MTIELGLTADSRWDIDVAGLVAAGGLRCHELLALVLSADEESTVSQPRDIALYARVFERLQRQPSMGGQHGSSSAGRPGTSPTKRNNRRQHLSTALLPSSEGP